MCCLRQQLSDIPARYVDNICKRTQARDNGIIMVDILTCHLDADKHCVVSPLLRVDLKDRDLHLGKRAGNIGNKGYSAVCVDLNLRLIYSCAHLARALFPFCGYPAVGVFKIVHTLDNVGAIPLVY